MLFNLSYNWISSVKLDLLTRSFKVTIFNHEVSGLNNKKNSKSFLQRAK